MVKIEHSRDRHGPRPASLLCSPGASACARVRRSSRGNIVSVVRAFALLLLIAWPSLAGVQQSGTDLAVSDREIEGRMIEFGRSLMKRKGAVRMKDLVGQLDRGRCSLSLAAPSSNPLRSEELIRKVRRSVLVVGSLFQCNGCKEWHLSTASGFALTEAGAIATCYHVVNRPDHAVMVVMTDDGRCFGVREVLAADRAHDVAILQVDGAGFAPLPIAARAPVGSPVFIVSHPSGAFYTFTAGMVSRYFVNRENSVESTMMAITADFGPGSSGCPVFNDCGTVVGMAESIVSNSFRSKKGHLEPGLIFKHARPADAVLQLLR